MITQRIGLAGAAGSGKTTAANFLVDKHRFNILGFATPLYKLGTIHTYPSIEWHSRVYGWTLDYLEPAGYSESERWKFVYDTLDVMDDIPVVEGKNRTLLQLLGTEVGRGLDEDLWTTIFENAVNSQGDNFRVVNDNLRFPNEFDCLERMGFVTIYLDVPLKIRAQRYLEEYGVPMDQKQLSHASEAYLEEIKGRCDYVFDNVVDTVELYRFLDYIVSTKHEVVK